MNFKSRDEAVTLRLPLPAEGAALHSLIRNCPPLDENSMYCNLLQCTHFANTSVVGELNGKLVAAVTGFRVPGRDDTLFIWQVAVAEAARGQALGARMLNHILARPGCASIKFLETTVTGSNEASWAMFEGFARRSGASLHRSVLFDETAHFGGQHDTEILARIGPLPESRDW